MFLYIILAVCLLGISVLAFRVSRYELLSPGVIMPLMFTFATLLSIIGWSSWNTISLQANAFTIILVGVVSFEIGIFLPQYLRGRKKGLFASANYSQRPLGLNSSLTTKEISIKYVILIVLVCVAIVLRVHETYKIGAQLNLKYMGYSDLAAQVRHATATIFTSEGVRLDFGFSFVERQLEKLVTVIGFVSSCLAASALLDFAKKKISFGLAILTLMLSSSFVILSGERARILYFFIAALLCFFVLKIRSQSKEIKAFSIKLILILLPITAVTILLFYFSGMLIGRTPGSGFIEYISFYLGGGIPSLQKILDVGLPSKSWGYFTFIGIYSFLYKYGFSEEFGSYSIAWIDTGGHASNIFTAFARYFLDFNLLGVIVLSTLSGLFFSWLYYVAKRSKSPISIFVFAYLSVYVIDLPRDEFLFSKLISSNSLLSLLLLVLITIAMTTTLKSNISFLKSIPNGRDINKHDCFKHASTEGK